MRIDNSLKNMIIAVISNLLTIIIGIVSRAFFIKFLGNEYLGINSLFSNIISMLAIAELGIGSTIIFYLYKPLAEDDLDTIKSLMRFYKKSYQLIGTIILIVGLMVFPFLKYVVDFDAFVVPINLLLVYLLFLIDAVLSYFLSYKRSILYADQKNYVIVAIHLIYTILLNLVQLVIMFATQNYYLYLLIKLVFRIIENLLINYYVDKKYNYLSSYANKLDKKIESEIFKKVKALILHKIGGFIVLGTDNIIISKYLGIVVVGLYSNYCLIIDSVYSLFNQALTSITASVGNLLVSEKGDKQFYIFKKIRFMNFWIATFSGVCIYIIINSFVTIWIGKRYLLNQFVVFVLVLNLYQKLMRCTYMNFKEAAGICLEDRFVPIIESVLNILFSIVLVKTLGLAGVFIGTFISSFALWCYSFPKFVYKKLFNRSYFDYGIETFGYLILFISVLLVTSYCANIFVLNDIYLDFIKNVILSVVLPNVVLVVVFRKDENFQYFIQLIKEKILKR